MSAMTVGERTDAPRLTPRMVALIPLVLAMLSMIGPFSIDTPFPAFAEMGDGARGRRRASSSSW